MLLLGLVFPHSLHTLFVPFSNMSFIVCEEKHQRNIRSPWATAGIGLGKNRGVVTQLNLKLEKYCLCRGLFSWPVCSHGLSFTIALFTLHHICPTQCHLCMSPGETALEKLKGRWGSVVELLENESDAQWWMVLLSLCCLHPGSGSRLGACWSLPTAVTSAPCCLWSTSSVLQGGDVDGLITDDVTDNLW